MSTRKTTYKREKVLIVSDDEDLNLLLEFLLQLDGFQVVVSRTSERAMQTLLKDQPKAIFFDMNFQGGNSLSLLEFFQEACPDTSTFTVVKPEFRALAEQTLRTGAQGFLMTPVDYRSVRTLLGGNQTVEAPIGSHLSTERRSKSVAIGN